MSNVFNKIEDFYFEVPKEKPILGLDFGEKTIGIAISDPSKSLALSLKTIFRLKFNIDVQEIDNIVNERDIGGIIIGLPINMDGSEGTRCQSTRAFARNLSKIILLPISFWDERLSTVSAEKFLIETKKTRKKRKKIIDTIAATIILQCALDRFKNF